MVLLSERDQRDLLIAAGLADFLVGGKLTAAARTAVVATLRRGLPVAGRAGISVAGTALGATRLLMANPYILGGTALYVGYQERDKIRSLLEQGYEIIEERLPTPSPPPSPSIPGVSEIVTGAPRPVTEFFTPRLPGILKRRRKPSGFNRAVSAGMKVVKKAKTYGGTGKIRPAKKAFAMVTKLASAKKKKKKAPKSGLRRRIWNAMKGLR
jgi:hypothetical protein